MWWCRRASPVSPFASDAETWGGVFSLSMDKFYIVHDAFTSAAPSVVCIQESKLQDIYTFKANTFLLPNLAFKFDFVAVNASCIGIVTAWDPKMFSLSNTLKHRYNLTVALRSCIAENFLTS